MKLPRKELLEVLKRVKPALSSNSNAVVELSHFWFDGKYVSAFDDIIGIRVEFETEFTGGLPGDKLLGIIENSRARTVEIESIENGNMQLKAGRTIVKFTSRPIDDWFWKPELPDTGEYKTTKEFLEAVDLTLVSVGTGRVLNPEQRGITVIQNGASADLYSTDAVTISWMKVPTDKDGVYSTMDHTRLILSTPFCEQLKQFKPGAKLSFSENAVYCTSEIVVGQDVIEEKGKEKTVDKKANILVFSKLVDDEDPVPFEEVINKYAKGNASFSVPEGFGLALDRALVMLETGKPAEISIEDDFLFLLAETPHGNVDDQVKLKDIEGQKDITVKVDLSLLRRGLDGRERMAVNRDCLVLKGPGDFVHVVATK